MSSIDTLFTSAKFADGSLNDIAVTAGRISAITPSGGAVSAAKTIDLGGTLVIPSFVEGHVHLDTSFHGDVWRPHVPYSNGFNVQERVAVQADNMAKAAPMAERARSQLELCLGHGSTRMRSHVMVDGSVGLTSLETILAVREAHRDVMDIQLVAFPQSGILRSPGTADLLDAAFDLGADVIGGLDPGGFDCDVEKHLDVVFGIA
ncbi:MAG: amidohydrolase family protein, partial [Hyphomicrobiales bacterium]|nr:amidohydrolase family protein [Hyphomicrobiales bacterium]